MSRQAPSGETDGHGLGRTLRAWRVCQERLVAQGQRRWAGSRNRRLATPPLGPEVPDQVV